LTQGDLWHILIGILESFFETSRDNNFKTAIEIHETRRNDTMNYSTAIFLISEEVRAVLVSYEVDDKYKKAARTLYKTLDKNVKVDDYVVIPTNTRHNMTVCKVVEVDVEVDFESAEEVKWLVGIVDCTNFEAVVKQEDEAVATIKKAELRRKKAELRKTFDEFNGDLKLLPIYTVEDKK